MDLSKMANMKPKKNLVGAPIPGQSLTVEPGSRPYEQPPQFTTEDEALDYLMPKILNAEVGVRLANLAERGMNIEAVADTILIGGFAQGMWTPDLAVLIAVPTVEMLAKSTELAGGKPVRLEDTDEYQDDIAEKLAADTSEQPPRTVEEAEEEPVEEDMMLPEEEADDGMGIMMPTGGGADNAIMGGM